MLISDLDDERIGILWAVLFLLIRVGDFVFPPAMGALRKEGLAAEDKAPDFEVELFFVPPPGRDGTLAELLADLATACLLTTPPARGKRCIIRLAIYVTFMADQI